MRREGEGRQPGRCDERYSSNTAVPANVLQQSCRAPGLQKHRWGCWLTSPSRDHRAARAGCVPFLPEPQGMAQDSPLACLPFSTSSRGL